MYEHNATIKITTIYRSESGIAFVGAAFGNAITVAFNWSGSPTLADDTTSIVDGVFFGVTTRPPSAGTATLYLQGYDSSGIATGVVSSFEVVETI